MSVIMLVGAVAIVSRIEAEERFGAMEQPVRIVIGQDTFGSSPFQRVPDHEQIEQQHGE